MKASAEVTAILTGLEQAGRLNAGVVVDMAADPASPLHAHFEWDDAEAAQRHRQDQARALIRSVRLTVTYHAISFEAPAFVVNPAPASGYIAISRLRNDEDAAREVVVTEFARAAAALSRARKIAAALGMEGEIEGLRQQVVGISERVQMQAGGSA